MADSNLSLLQFMQSSGYYTPQEIKEKVDELWKKNAEAAPAPAPQQRRTSASPVYSTPDSASSGRKKQPKWANSFNFKLAMKEAGLEPAGCEDVEVDDEGYFKYVEDCDRYMQCWRFPGNIIRLQ